MTTANRTELERQKSKLTKTKATLRYYRDEIENMRMLMRWSGSYWTKKRIRRREELHELVGVYGPRVLSQERFVEFLANKVKEEET